MVGKLYYIDIFQKCVERIVDIASFLFESFEQKQRHIIFAYPMATD